MYIYFVKCLDFNLEKEKLFENISKAKRVTIKKTFVAKL